ncbi:MAG: DUF2075 domain-containing protein [Planctomycetes bacterium]|nr:DUF2075 domain-containing protein [Planctomycetota bacterium]
MKLPQNSLLIASRAWYDAPLAEFLDSPPAVVLGRLTQNSDFSVEPDQRDAWLGQIDVLRTALAGSNGNIYLEFNIPRMGKRIDAVVLVGPVVFVIEFKVGAESFDRTAIDQAWDYAFDLKNFHEASHDAPIVPILIATEAQPTHLPTPSGSVDGVYEPLGVHPDGLRGVIAKATGDITGRAVVASDWQAAPYRPTPTIIEAARSLYAQHGVHAIRSFDAGQKNLAVTSGRVEEIVRDARENRRKAICFVTGVPGAGKTLVGLNLATQHRAERVVDPAVFLSGNGPLVDVLREALIRDEYQRRRAAGEKVRKGKVGEGVKQFIQNVHHFRDDNLQHAGAPAEHVAIFDEAQRAWNLQKTADFMQRRKKVPNFNQSEPEFLISCMDRHDDWSVIVCLVGGGQEINTGEAGIAAWLDAINSRFPHWDVHISSNLHDSEYAAGKAMEFAVERSNAILDDALHLAVSMRSFRAENVSGFVKALLDRDLAAARTACHEFSDRYPMRLTRNMDAAKQWIRSRARGSQRYGLLCSSKAMRLKPHAIDVRHNVNPVHWFLNDADDTRSSQYLEDAATEFQVQGLEVDWACVNWDADFRATEDGWSHHDFRGSSWCNIRNEANKQYLTNAYRVLLTRARQGMVIFVPPGDSTDHTRKPQWYDSTYEYLKSAGLAEL